MNATIHFIQENNLNQNSSNTANNYNWSNSDRNNNNFLQTNLPMQQIHYVDSNIALINGNFSNKNVSLLQMDSIDHHNCATSNLSLANGNNLMISNNEENQLTYLTPLINVTINEPQKTVNKLLPLNIETVNSNEVYQQVNYNNLNNSLPSMAASFGSPALVNSYNEKTNKTNKLNKTSNAFKNNWSNNSKPGRKPLVAKTYEKQTNEFSVNNLSKVIKRNSTNQTKNRKKVACNSLNKNLVSSTDMIDNKSNSSNDSNNFINLSNSNKLSTSTSSTKSPVVLRRNERERERVRKVNLGFKDLKSKLPNSNKKMSKVQTLKCAIDHIRKLRELLEQPSSIVHCHINTNYNKNNIKEIESCENNQPNKMPKNNLIELNNQLNVLQSMDYYDLDAY